MVVNIGLLKWVRYFQCNVLPGKYLGIEVPLHGEAGSKQSQPFESQGFSGLAGCLHDADERDGLELSTLLVMDHLHFASISIAVFLFLCCAHRCVDEPRILSQRPHQSPGEAAADEESSGGYLIIEASFVRDLLAVSTHPAAAAYRN